MLLPTKTVLLLIGGFGLLCAPAHAQKSFHVGPRVGFNMSSAPYEDTDYYINEYRSFRTRYRSGLEVGIQGSIGFGHLAVQPALLFSQKGFRIQDTTGGTGLSTIQTVYDISFRLNYLTLPLNLVYALWADGQGFQAFAGPYVSWLVGGSYHQKLTQTFNGIVSPPTDYRRAVAGSGAYHTIDVNSVSENNYYSRRVDAGFQAGIGYRRGAFLGQASYSHGVSNLGVSFEYSNGSQVEGPVYKNRAFQASLSYFLLSKGGAPTTP